jgi:DNA-binding transcriptional MerR regulator
MRDTDFAGENFLTLVCVNETTPTTYSLEAAASLVGMHPEMLRHYCQLGLLGDSPLGPETELIFDDDAVCKLRRFENYRRNHGMNRKTLRLIFSLFRDIEILQTELRFLRGW